PPPPGLGLVVATPGGALPMGLVRAVVHGPDLAVGVGLLVLAADARGLWSLAVGATLALLAGSCCALGSRRGFGHGAARGYRGSRE
ncbi:hypothetical protein B277_01070, partial [Janibacter hoylei PVAS-1]